MKKNLHFSPLGFGVITLTANNVWKWFWGRECLGAIISRPNSGVKVMFPAQMLIYHFVLPVLPLKKAFDLWDNGRSLWGLRNTKKVKIIQVGGLTPQPPYPFPKTSLFMSRELLSPPFPFSLLEKSFMCPPSLLERACTTTITFYSNHSLSLLEPHGGCVHKKTLDPKNPRPTNLRNRGTQLWRLAL